MSKILNIVDLKKYYNSKDGIVKSLDGIDISLKKGEVIGIIGESGCGKTTLAKCLIGIEDRTAGEIYFRDQSIDELKKDRLKYRKMCQMVFQNPYDVFDNKMKIGEILDKTLRVHKIGTSKADRLDKISYSLRDAGFDEPLNYLDRYPKELSGGQLQRLSIIRSQLLDPEIIILDEPVSMLDVSIRADIINLLIKISEQRGVSMIFISHDISTISFLASKIYVMYLGKVVEYGPTSLVLKNPAHPYTRALISHMASIDPNHKINPIKIKGEVPKPIDQGPGCYFYKRCFACIQRCICEYPPFIEVDENRYISCFNPQLLYK